MYKGPLRAMIQSTASAMQFQFASTVLLLAYVANGLAVSVKQPNELNPAASMPKGDPCRNREPVPGCDPSTDKCCNKIVNKGAPITKSHSAGPQ
ncbi:hypothetical protein BCR37DRAFT_378637 [Protomyces lactucae-debilis]|uniref:Uncharacterized protein n=1 Tax=Protomyces lactucae-debilis TaxID=2754530 RepID=A0A1Y2FLM8_PROLT|nr:uncharacterized protein BCR37DRAFT_378637 [Protomyces lactucae-debilis]ORY83675.1 hypothetical protein BCR37DRAFT_378637 [Protomyces lactucae-debilis]